MIPKTWFSAPLSKSAKDTESRIRNIFQGQHRRPAALALVLVAAVALLCGSVVAIHAKKSFSSTEGKAEQTVEPNPVHQTLTKHYDGNGWSVDLPKSWSEYWTSGVDPDMVADHVTFRSTGSGEWQGESFAVYTLRRSPDEELRDLEQRGFAVNRTMRSAEKDESHVRLYDGPDGCCYRTIWQDPNGDYAEELLAIADSFTVVSPRESLLRALRGELAFPLDTSLTGSYIVSAPGREVTLSELTAEDTETMESAAYALLDLNGDGTDEAVYRRGDYRGFYVLRVREGKVYGYEFNYRGLMRLKQDGTFAQSSGAGDNGYGRLFFQGADLAIQDFMWLLENGTWSSYTIEGREVSRDEYFLAMETQDAKPDVEWQEFAPRVEQSAPAQRLEFGAPDHGELPEPMEPLADWQKELLADIPASELPRETVELGKAVRSDFWRDTLIPLAYDESADVTLYGVVAAGDLESAGERELVHEHGASSDGIVLRSGDRAAYFPTEWYGNNHYGVDPWMEVSDFDGDGADEAAVCLLVGTGTGVSTSFLHVIDLDTLERHTVEISTLNINYSYDSEKRTVTVSGNGLTRTAAVPEGIEPLEELQCGSIIEYEYRDGTIFCTLPLSYRVVAGYFCDVEAPVVWNGDNYVLGAATALELYE